MTIDCILSNRLSPKNSENMSKQLSKCIRIPTLPFPSMSNLEECKQILEKYKFQNGKFVGVNLIEWKEKCIWALKFIYGLSKEEDTNYCPNGIPLADTRYEYRLESYMNNIVPDYYSLGRIYVEYYTFMKQCITVWNVEFIAKDALLDMYLGGPTSDEVGKKEEEEVTKSN